MKSLHYVNCPVIKESDNRHLLLVSLPNKVWNPVFLTGTITFVCSMLFRGFLDASFAVWPLAFSTLLLFYGVWILSSNGLVVFDMIESNCYCIYKHLGYLQKSYIYPITSIDRILVKNYTAGRFSVYLSKDDGSLVKIMESADEKELKAVAHEIANYLNIPLDD